MNDKLQNNKFIKKHKKMLHNIVMLIERNDNFNSLK